MTTQENQTNNNRRFIPLAKWNEYHDWPSLGGLRWMVFHAKSNGMSCCITRLGRRVLIDEQAFFNWVSAHGSE